MGVCLGCRGGAEERQGFPKKWVSSRGSPSPLPDSQLRAPPSGLPSPTLSLLLTHRLPHQPSGLTRDWGAESLTGSVG